MRWRLFFFTVMAVCVICLWGQAGDCGVLKQQGYSRVGAPMDLGKIRMPWSRANKRFGYVYAVEGVTFANVIPGPPSWTCKGYYSYVGVKAGPQTVNPQGVSFSSKASLVFDTLEDDALHSPHVPVLLVQHNGVLGVIEFIRMDDYGLHYRYGWIDPDTIIGDPSLPDDPSAIRFDKPVVSNIYSDMDYETVTVTNGATVVFNASLRIKGSIKILHGNVVLEPGIHLFVKDVDISEGSTLSLGRDTRVTVTGNWSNYGSVSPNQGTVVFSGAEPQRIVGPIHFNSLEIDTDFQVDAGPMSAQSLSIYSGVFAPATNSRFHHVFIDTKGVLFPQEEAVILISGHLDTEGGFVHNYGTVILGGFGQQHIHTNGDPFFNLWLLGGEVIFFKPPVIENPFILPPS